MGCLLQGVLSGEWKGSWTGAAPQRPHLGCPGRLLASQHSQGRGGVVQPLSLPWIHKATPSPASPVWKNFPEYPKLKVKFGMWVRSSFCVSNSACEGGRESTTASARGSRGQLHHQTCSKAHARAGTFAPESSGEGCSSSPGAEDALRAGKLIPGVWSIPDLAQAPGLTPVPRSPCPPSQDVTAAP